MGEKFVNYQVRSRLKSSIDVAKAVCSITIERAYVSPEKNGWVTIYDKMSECLKYDEINYFAEKLSATLATTVLVFVVFDGVNFIYLIYENGVVVDEFYDDPEGLTFGYEYVDSKVMDRFSGNPEKVVNYCTSEVSSKMISEFLHLCKERSDVDYLGQDAVCKMANFLGIDEDRAIL